MKFEPSCYRELAILPHLVSDVCLILSVCLCVCVCVLHVCTQGATLDERVDVFLCVCVCVYVCV